MDTGVPSRGRLYVCSEDGAAARFRECARRLTPILIPRQLAFQRVSISLPSTADGVATRRERTSMTHSTKQKILELVQQLPPDASIDDVMERLYSSLRWNAALSSLRPVGPFLTTRSGVATRSDACSLVAAGR